MKQYLYHGSKFDNQDKPLLPGFYHTQIEVFWDGKFESNKFLYACDSAAAAIMLGVGSLAEKDLKSIGFKYDDDGKEVIFMFDKDDFIQPKELEKQLKGKTMFLYTIRMRPTHGWIENDNPYNNIEGEYKTPKSIPSNDYVMAEIEILKWLKDNDRKIVTEIRD